MSRVILLISIPYKRVMTIIGGLAMKKICILILLGFMLVPGMLAKEKKAEKKGIKPALIILDVQNKWLPMMQQEGQKDAISYMDQLGKYFRKKGFPVILIYHSDPTYGPKPGTKDYEFPEAIEIADSDIKITKQFGNSFKKTNLEKILKEKGINTLFLTGLSGTGCVLATYYGAVDRDIKMFLVEKTILSPKAEYTGFVEEICQSVGFGALSLILQGAQDPS